MKILEKTFKDILDHSKKVKIKMFNTNDMVNYFFTLIHLFLISIMFI